uniref:Uncharacterized protein n=1 Tax=Caenorhabditis japonica TaxID=281687 RepID=A0A8R1E9K0_CAEJA
MCTPDDVVNPGGQGELIHLNLLLFPSRWLKASTWCIDREMTYLMLFLMLYNYPHQPHTYLLISLPN